MEAIIRDKGRFGKGHYGYWLNKQRDLITIQKISQNRKGKGLLTKKQKKEKSILYKKYYLINP